jgi:hypothetical protein
MSGPTLRHTAALSPVEVVGVASPSSAGLLAGWVAFHGPPSQEGAGSKALVIRDRRREQQKKGETL